jgi:cobalt-zinc-cadmium efflux system membrane fusion protein
MNPTHDPSHDPSPDRTERSEPPGAPSTAAPPEPSAASARASLGANGRALVSLGLGLAAGLLIGAASVPREEAEASPPAPAAAPERTHVRLPPDLLERAGIRTATAGVSEFGAEVSLVGTVAFDPRRVADVGGRIPGRVVRLHVAPGDWVEAGAPLAEIESPELGDAVAELLAARARLLAANTHRTRAEGLSARDLTTAGEVESARANSSALEAEVAGAAQRLRALGLSEGELRAIERGGRSAARSVTLRAPIAGEVISLHSMLGQVVDPTHPILRLGDLSTVWIELEVYERDLSRVQVGDRAEIRSETHPDHPFEGLIEHVGATVDPETRTADVRIAVHSADRALRPGQFVHAFVSSAHRARRALSVPAAAVVTVEGASSVFVPAGEGEFELRAVEVGETHGERVEITGGLAEGDPVVVGGVFALKSELLR